VRPYKAALAQRAYMQDNLLVLALTAAYSVVMAAVWLWCMGS